MSTVISFLLAIAIIFWRPPFKTSNYLKRIFRPIVLIILLLLLIFIGVVRLFTTSNQNKIKAAKLESKIHSCKLKLTH